MVIPPPLKSMKGKRAKQDGAILRLGLKEWKGLADHLSSLYFQENMKLYTEKV